MKNKWKIINVSILILLLVSFVFPAALFAEEELLEDETYQSETQPPVEESPEVSNAISNTASSLIQPALDEELYTLAMLFGEGDYAHIQRSINTALNISSLTTSWTLSQLASIKRLYIGGDNSADFPKDISVFSGLEFLFIEHSSNIETLEFKYKNNNSKLQTVALNYLTNLTTIKNIDLDFSSNPGNVFEIRHTPRLTEISNITANANEYYFQMDTNNLPIEMVDKINSNQNNFNEMNSENTAMVDNLSKNYTYEDAVAEVEIEPLKISGVSLGTNGHFMLMNSYIDSIDMSNIDTLRQLQIQNVVIDSISDLSITLENAADFYFSLANVLVNTIGDLNATAKNSGNIYITMNDVTANSIGKRTINATQFDQYLSSTYIKEIGDVTFNGLENDISPYSHFTMQFQNFSSNSIGNITTTSPTNNSYSSIYANQIVANSLGNISLSHTHESTNSQGTAHSTFNIHQGEIKKMGEISIDSSDTTAITSSAHLYFYQLHTADIAPINISADMPTVNFMDSYMEVPNLIVKGLSTSINIDTLYSGKIDKINDITVRKRTLKPDFAAEHTSAQLDIRSSKPISSVGNISIETFDESIETIFTVDGAQEGLTIDSIGDIYINNLRTLDLKDLKIKKIGQLDLEKIETIDLSGNQLTHLKVKDNVFADTLNSYTFEGNQIAGDLPIKEALRNQSKQIYNFFNILQKDVIDQSYLYILADEEKYAGVNNEAYTIYLDENEELNIDTLIDQVRMHNEQYNDDENVLFAHHTWKYKLSSSNVRTNGYSNEITYGDSTVVQGLKAGENNLELSLYGANQKDSENKNAKVYFKVIKKSSPMDENITEDGKTTIETTTKENSPFTGDLNYLLFFIVLIIASSSIVIYNYKSRKLYK